MCCVTRLHNWKKSNFKAVLIFTPLPYQSSVFSMFLFYVLKVTTEVGKLLGEEKVDAILCVAGGWAGGSAKAKCKPLVHACH